MSDAGPAATVEVAGIPERAPQLAGWRHVYSGKVRDIYVPDARPTRAEVERSEYESDEQRMLVVASDRISAFDHVLSPGIPGKGALLTRLSLWWFDQLRDVPNHLREGEIPAGVADRAMLVDRLEMFPIECVVRGYLTGSGFAEYQQLGSVCGVPLPEGLANGDRLPEAIFTPAFKAEQGEHDENISFERMVELIGEQDAKALRDLSLSIYRRASDIALAHGLIIADTKFEFGRDSDTGEITLGDEVLTSDSSRYWSAEAYATGDTPKARMASYDKQIVRDWLTEHWDGERTPPPLPRHVIDETLGRYRELCERLAG